MTSNNGYIYIRQHIYYENDKICKLGKSKNIPDRDNAYATGEYKRGKFVLVIEILNNQTSDDTYVEILLQQHFKNYHSKIDGGSEFYQNKIIDEIVPFLSSTFIKFKVLTEEEINNLIHQERIKKLKEEEINNVITPYEEQQKVLDKIEDFYTNNNIGKIIWACGLGKALLGIFIVKKLNCKLVVIGVPSIYLQKQMKNEIIRIYNNHKNILYIGGETEKNENYTIESTTKEDDINIFVNKKSSDCKFLITTYDSCNKLSNINFDFKIGDEAHHLVGSEFEKTKDSFHKIKSNKSLFMTATEKVIENNRTNKVIYSMDDKNIFGEIIDVKSINWAIENKKITDYNLVILKNTDEEIDNIINSLKLGENNEVQNSIMHHKDLFLSAFMSLKSIEKYTELTHILIYTNKTENSELVEKYINVILKLNIININKENYYNKSLHSKSSENLNDIKLSDGSIKEGEISKFKKASWGIISSVYIFGEGFDCPKLNGVVFGENMESDIRIVQSTLRPNRLDSSYPNKKAYVIIPYIDTENFITDNESFDKCRKIIAKIRNVDERIEQKINVVSLNKSSSKPSDDPKEKIKYHHIIENGDELTKIMLRLRYSRALGSIHSEEQDEFNYVRELNKELNIQSKEQYADKVIKDKHKNYIENPEEYFKSKCVWSNWYDFIGFDTKKFIQDKNDWINFCKENNVKSLDEYNELCKLYDALPMNPADFYIGFVSIPIELGLYTKRRK
jgi:predicted helicase